MNVIALISLRNLLRQKRRNILLGIAMAFGTLILVLANSFIHGITDVIINKLVVNISGHISVQFTEGNNLFKQVFHDGDRMLATVKKELPDITQIQEAMGVFARAIGNGKSDNVIMVGVDFSVMDDPKKTEADRKRELEDYKQNFHMLDGDFLDLKRKDIENPVGISIEKAKYLDVKKGDVLRVRFPDINGQSQAARLTVAAVFKPANAFMSNPIFLEIHTIKSLMGYGPHDIPQLYIRVKDGKNFAAKDADKLHDALQPAPAVIFGTLPARFKNAPVSVLGLRSDTAAAKLVAAKFSIVKGDSVSAFGKEGACLAESLAAALVIRPGDTCAVTYHAKYDSFPVTARFPVKAIIRRPKGVPGNVLLVNEKDFYAQYYRHWPAYPAAGSGAFIPSKEHALAAVFDPEWVLLKRCRTTDEVSKLSRELGRTRYRGVSVNVQSMYETASAVLQLETALNLITFYAVMVLFFIILIGVVNTLRMTIRERTREIGTVRAIGMQKKDVRNAFILETFFLALFSALTGTFLALLIMWILSLVPVNLQDNPLSMLLVNGHLNFKPTLGGTVLNNLIILFIAVVTAWFPARRAAKLPAAAALRHYE